jgi:hypothetical protein
MGAQYISCWIENLTGETLKVKSHKLEWGKFYDPPNQSPVDIPAGEKMKAFRSSGKDGAASGTEGTVVYQLGNKENETLEIYWDVPWGSSTNTLKVTTYDRKKVLASPEGWNGKGTGEEVTITVAKIAAMAAVS